MAPKPPVIGAAASDAQVAVGVYWYIPAGQDTLAEPPLEGARLPSGGTTAGPWPVVSKCALREGRQRERNTQVIPDAPPSVPSCWSITAFPACVILPQMNRQPMCIWVVKPPFTQYISKAYGKKASPAALVVDPEKPDLKKSGLGSKVHHGDKGPELLQPFSQTPHVLGVPEKGSVPFQFPFSFHSGPPGCPLLLGVVKMVPPNNISREIYFPPVYFW